MSEDFASAAVRHWNSSDCLAKQGNWQEAAYLAGYVAECSLKFCIAKANLRPKDFYHELNLLSTDGLALASMLAPLMKRYRLKSDFTILFAWRPEHRYQKSGFWADDKFKEMIAQAEQVADQILLQMIFDGYHSEFPQ